MESLIVRQFIFTKFSKEDLPRPQTDFHVVFYPVDYCNSNHRHILETHVRVPQTFISNTDESRIKDTIFFLSFEEHKNTNIQADGGTYESYNDILNYLPDLVWINLKSLPEERDHLGRRGIVLGNGFIFPAKLWQQAANFKDLRSLVEKYLFASRDEVRASARIDKDSSHIQPIHILETDLQHILTEELQPLQSGFDFQMVLLLENLAQDRGSERKLLIKGNADTVDSYLNKMFGYLPAILKSKLSFDSSYDGGLSTFPMLIAGYPTPNERPSGQNPILIDLDNQTIDYQSYNCTCKQPYQIWLEQRFSLSGFGKQPQSMEDNIQVGDLTFGNQSTLVTNNDFSNQNQISSPQPKDLSTEIPNSCLTKNEIENAYFYAHLLMQIDPPKYPDNLPPNNLPLVPEGFIAKNSELIKKRFYHSLQKLLNVELANVIEQNISEDKRLRLWAKGLSFYDLASVVESILLKEPKVYRHLTPQIIENLSKLNRVSLRLTWLLNIIQGKSPSDEEWSQFDTKLQRDLAFFAFNTFSKPKQQQVQPESITQHHINYPKPQSDESKPEEAKPKKSWWSRK